MPAPDFHSIDFRDLQILRVLLEERHVSRTAARLGITQSAVSKSLRRLREKFADPLLIRGPGGYQLSHNAKSIEPRLLSVFAQIQRLYENPSETPDNIDTEIVIGMADDAAILLLPRIRERLQATAPDARLSVTNSGEDVLAKLRTGEIDLLLETAPVIGSGFYTHPIVDWPWCCVMAKTNSLASKPLTLQRYVDADHGLVSFSGKRFGIVDEVLGRQDKQRQIVLTVPYFSVVPYVVQGSSVIFTVPLPLGKDFADRFDVVLRAPPIDIAPLKLSLIWHHRNQHDRIHRWIRALIVEETAALPLRGNSAGS